MLDLPEMFRAGEEAVYTAEQLEPTLARLRAAAGEVSGDEVSAAALIGAWRRIGELRLPRKAAPGSVLDGIEELVGWWESQGVGGMSGYAYSLGAEERLREAERIREMLRTVEEAVSEAPPSARYRTE